EVERPVATLRDRNFLCGFRSIAQYAGEGEPASGVDANRSETIAARIRYRVAAARKNQRVRAGIRRSIRTCFKHGAVGRESGSPSIAIDVPGDELAALAQIQYQFQSQRIAGGNDDTVCGEAGQIESAA